ncbi:hypothetical protein ABK040_016548 [Willaertia magna]
MLIGFIVNGKVQYIGEDINDFGVIIVKNNVVFDIAPKKANEIDVEIFNFVENYKRNIVKYKEMDYDNLNNCLIGEYALFLYFNSLSPQKDTYQGMCKSYFKIKKEMDLRELKKMKRVENFRENLKRVKLSNDLDFKFKNNNG